VAAETGMPVISVANLHDLLAFTSENAELVSHREPLLAYRTRYGAAATN
jgi:orotate phosphoribosyltransferase